MKVVGKFLSSCVQAFILRMKKGASMKISNDCGMRSGVLTGLFLNFAQSHNDKMILYYTGIKI